MKDRFNISTRLMLLLAAPLLLLAQACNTYSYFDIDNSLDPTFNINDASRIQACHLFATGADTGDALLGSCPEDASKPTRELGFVRYSTFADSGNITFTLKVYSCMAEQDSCLLGSSMVMLPVTAGGTTVARNDGTTAQKGLIVKCTGATCTTN
jgi:hypothetical protein